jgi:hypothetical protein
MASLLGRGAEELAAVLQATGFRRDGEQFRLGPRAAARGPRTRRPREGAFAGLARLKVARG